MRGHRRRRTNEPNSRPHQESPALLSRRQVLQTLGALGFGASACTGPLISPSDETQRPWRDPPINAQAEADESARSNNVRALMDVLIPAERDEAGALLSPGALEVGAYEMLELRNFVSAARGQQLLPELPGPLLSGLGGFDEALRSAVSADLDALAFEQRRFVAFRHLPASERIAAVAEGFDRDEISPLLHFVRAACFIAFLGAVRSDAGLVAIGFPAFEDFTDRRAVSGYPRTTSGRLVDPQREDLRELAARGELDDYTYNMAPMPTPGDDLSSVLDAGGDLI